MVIKTRKSEFWTNIPSSMSIELKGSKCTIIAINPTELDLCTISNLLEINTEYIGYISTSYVIYEDGSEKLTYSYDSNGMPKNKHANYSKKYNQFITVTETTTKILRNGKYVEVPKYTFTIAGENVLELQIKL